MRGLYGWDRHGEYRRHARDTAADAHTASAHDGPRHAANDALKLKMLLGPEAPRRESPRAEASDSPYIARHARAGGGDQGQVPEQMRPNEARPEHAPPETPDKPASKIAGRRLDELTQAPDVAAREKPRLKGKALTFWSATSRWTITAAADHLHFMPSGLAGEIADAIGV